MSSAVRQNFHEDCEASINKQINMELHASYVYMSMASYFNRDDISLKGMAKFFNERSDEERDHAQKFMKFQNKRGGRVVLKEVEASKVQEWGNALNGLEEALKLEKKVNESLLHLHELASKHNDAHLTDFLEGNFLDEQVEDIKKLADMITSLKRAGPTGLGEYLFDKEL